MYSTEAPKPMLEPLLTKSTQLEQEYSFNTGEASEAGYLFGFSETMSPDPSARISFLYSRSNPTTNLYADCVPL